VDPGWNAGDRGGLVMLEGVANWWCADRFELLSKKEPEVERPKHYEDMILDPLTIAAMYELTPCLTHAVKYLLRAGHKGDRLEDLDKAIRCLYMEKETMIRASKIACGEDKNAVWSTKL